MSVITSLPVAVQLKSLATVSSLRDLIPCRFKSGAEEYTDEVVVIDDQNRRHGKKHSCYSVFKRNSLASTGAPRPAGREDQAFQAMAMKKS
jgi:hypothetical protein